MVLNVTQFKSPFNYTIWSLICDDNGKETAHQLAKAGSAHSFVEPK
jgi:hypothetical protein